MNRKILPNLLVAGADGLLCLLIVAQRPVDAGHWVVAGLLGAGAVWFGYRAWRISRRGY